MQVLFHVPFSLSESVRGAPKIVRTMHVYAQRAARGCRAVVRSLAPSASHTETPHRHARRQAAQAGWRRGGAGEAAARAVSLTLASLGIRDKIVRSSFHEAVASPRVVALLKPTSPSAHIGMPEGRAEAAVLLERGATVALCQERLSS